MRSGPHLWLALLLTGCGSACGHAEPAPAATPAERPHETPAEPRATEPATPAEACVLAAEPAAAAPVHPNLLAVAAQYFHPWHRGGFDAYRGGGNVFPWFDRFDLESPVRPPRGTRVTASTHGALLLTRDGELGVMRRDADGPRWLGERLYAIEAVETGAGGLLALVRSGSTLRLVRLGAGGGPTEIVDLGLPDSGHDTRLVLTAGDRPVLAWAERDGGTLRLMLSWSLDPDDGQLVDEVQLPTAVAELSERTGTGVVAAAHGPAGVAVAWRPLTDATYTDVGTRSTPPTTPAEAEVRWRTVAADGTLGDLHAHATEAQPLPGVTGVGPWPLGQNGLGAATLDGHALFAWLEQDAIVGALATDDAPTRLATVSRAPLITFRPAPDGLTMLLLDSSPNVDAVALTCASID